MLNHKRQGAALNNASSGSLGFLWGGAGLLIRARFGGCFSEHPRQCSRLDSNRSDPSWGQGLTPSRCHPPTIAHLSTRTSAFWRDACSLWRKVSGCTWRPGHVSPRDWTRRRFPLVCAETCRHFAVDTMSDPNAQRPLSTGTQNAGRQLFQHTDGHLTTSNNSNILWC